MTAAQPPQTSVQAALESIRLNPVAIAWSVNLGVTLLAGYGLRLTRDQTGAVITIASALVAVITALTARPYWIPGITGAAASALAACAAFGLKLSPEQVSAAAAALSVVLMLVTHAAVIPVAAARQGLTAHEILLAATVRRPPP